MIAQKVDIPVNRFMSGMHEWHRKVLRAFDCGRYTQGLLRRFFWLNWHRRARKTTLGLNLLIRECCSNPRHIYDYVGPTYRQAKAIVWRDPDMLDSYLPDRSVMGWEKNNTELFVKFANQSMLVIKGADEPDSLRGPKCNGVWFDEWALMNPMVIMAIYRPILAEDPKRWAGYSFTPKGQNHAYEGIQDAQSRQDTYVSTLPADVSGIISKSELEAARRDMPPELFQQEFMCSFIAEEERAFISSASLDLLRGLVYVEPLTRTFISVDPATGGDECVAKAFRNRKEIEQRVYHHRDEMKIITELQLFAEDVATRNFVIDGIGVGSGIASRLSQLKYNVIVHKSSESAAQDELFANKKAEMWWIVARNIRDGEGDYPEDFETRRQISAVKYKIQPTSGKIIVEPKEVTKKALGCSPDRAESWVQAQYYWDSFEPDGEESRIIKSVPSYVSIGVA